MVLVFKEELTLLALGVAVLQVVSRQGLATIGRNLSRAFSYGHLGYPCVAMRYKVKCESALNVLNDVID